MSRRRPASAASVAASGSENTSASLPHVTQRPASLLTRPALAATTLFALVDRPRLTAISHLPEQVLPAAAGQECLSQPVPAIGRPSRRCVPQGADAVEPRRSPR